MKNLSDLINKDLLDSIKYVDGGNCYIITAGNQETQLAKLINSEILNHILKEKAIIVDNDKRVAIKKICEEFPNEKIIFIDDKQKNINDAESLNIPNLKNILFDNNGLFKIYKELCKQSENHIQLETTKNSPKIK